ncbi:hypothetical protein A7U60_g3115 [Sanghuangporus baumii]|uniref:Shugoshin C-terminal domain-containing protein n=1 Tax=Sanghuangporus baumii TaxID=108892 RepID=A0A9Q5I175_SANBA|nr:hypothetical protein A7U60_g3115 [Sanghuangporus baumii]
MYAAGSAKAVDYFGQFSETVTNITKASFLIDQQAPLVSVLLANVVMNVYITIHIFYISSTTQLLDGPPDSYITAFVLTAVLDIMITALMMWFLLRVKSQVISRHLARVIVRLHRMVWEAAVPPCACAIVACAVYITMSQDNLWDVFLQSILGKLYVISLFVILNGRADLKRPLPAPTQSTRMSRYWANDAPFQFRVDLTSVVDLQAQSDMEMTPTTDAPLRPGGGRHEWKARLSPRDSTIPELGRGGLAAVPSHEPFFFEVQDRAETSSFVMENVVLVPVGSHFICDFFKFKSSTVGFQEAHCRPTNVKRVLIISSFVAIVPPHFLISFLSASPSRVTMSRRDSSRVHIAVRQNDTLAEFENFKKKFLFANKQITKQNCSLSMKIEELNAHISSLYVENLRLRASEIALQSQLKREKAKSHKIMADAEAAVLNLLKHFGIIRESYNVPTERPHSPKDTMDSPPSPRLRKPPPRSPSVMRLAQFPSVPDISEEPELNETSSEGNDDEHFPVEGMNSVISSRRRSSLSCLPVPSRVSTPPPGSVVPSLEGATATTTSRKRKLTRRASGIISPNEPASRPVSPVLGSPMQQDVDLSAEEEAVAMQAVEDIVAREEEKEQEIHRKPRKKSRTRDESESDAIEKKERKKIKDKDTGSASRLKDVTNSPRRRRAAAATASAAATADSTNDSELIALVFRVRFADRITIIDIKAERKEDIPDGGLPPLVISPLLGLPLEDDIDYLPTPLPSSASNTPAAQHFTLPSSDAEAGVGGRERRARKSVNYAEPKLNKKMRKPDAIPPPGARPSLASMAAVPSITPAPTSSSSSSSNQNQIRGATGGSSPELEEEIEVPPPYRLSLAKTASNATGSRRSAASSSLTSSSAVPSAKRRRPKHVRIPSEEGEGMATDERDDDEEDQTDGGEQADSEFGEFRAWANVNTRRKSVMNGHDTISGMEDGFGRRHSMAV